MYESCDFQNHPFLDVSLSFLAEIFSVANSWIPGSDFRHVRWGHVSAVIDGSPLGFVAAGERFRLKVLRLVEGQMSKPENIKPALAFNKRNMQIKFKRIAG